MIHKILIVSCFAICGGNVLKGPSTEVLNVATTGLEDIFLEVAKQPLAIKNISVETNDNDQYYLSWFFDNGNNDEIESTIDVHVRSDDSMDYFRHFKNLHKSQFFKKNTGKLDKCSAYNAILQAHNKFGDSEKYLFNFNTSPTNIDNIQQNITKDKTTLKWSSECANFQVTIREGSDSVEVFNLTNNIHQLDIDEELYCTEASITALSANGSKIGNVMNTKMVPGPVTEVKLQPADTSILVSWTIPDDITCVKGYNIYLGDLGEFKRVEDPGATSYNYENLNSCQEYKIKVVSFSEDHLSTPVEETAITDVPNNLSPVENLVLKESDTDNTISVTWTVVSQDVPCITGYEIKVNGIIIETPQLPPTQTDYTIRDTNACETYEVSIVTVAGELTSQASSQEIITKARDLSPVENVVLKESDTDNTISVTWTAVPQDASCITGYEITVNGITQTPQLPPTQTDYTIRDTNACERYEVSIVAVAGLLTSQASSKEMITKATALNAPKLEVDLNNELDVNSIRFTVIPDPDTSNTCKLRSIDITCVAKAEENNIELPGIVLNRTKNFLTPVEEISYKLELDGLSPSTNYTCFAISKTENELPSAKSEEVTASTKILEGVVKSISLGVILGITFGVIFTCLIFFGSYFFYKNRMSKKSARTNMVNPMHPYDGDIAVLAGTNSEAEDGNGNDFAALQRTSEQIKAVTTIAEADANRKRNRYVNILPFDSTRVILYDGVESDYINASFIKGYSSQIEYIAAQGPLECTVTDFWKMVTQEKVTTILMLTQLREQNRDKCFKYFPINHENIRFNDINLYCSEEDVDKTYIRRKIILDIGKEQFNVQHFQYTDWPDFNVPDGTESMIKFVKKIRKLKAQLGGVILVHCSAGVGRTGTLISIDILLQAIDDDKDWNIYETVYDLRTQRVNMVQNEKQYLYIGSCVEDYIKSKRKSTAYNIEVEDPIYENVKNAKY